VLADLKQRLARARFPGEIPGSNWDYGTNLAYLKELVAYWRDRYDWRAAETELNALPQFRAEVGGLGIHYIHVRGKGPRPFPLVITHGWPGSVTEFVEIIGPLTDPAAHGGDAADAFDVVCPSMPGYGFSDHPVEPGMDPERIAALWAELMQGLGYQRFGAQGGDWGSSVATCLGFAHADAVVGIHLNYIPGSYAPYLGPGARGLSAAERVFQQERERWLQTEGGYGQIQRTKPQTLAYGLNDSPAGLAAWIVEKFRAWSDCNGDVERRFTKDELLTNIAIYWFTETIGSSARLYDEGRQRPLQFGHGERIQVPCGLARLPKEAPMPPREWVERCYNLQRWAELPRGHFAAMEEPELLAQDLRAFFRPLR